MSDHFWLYAWLEKAFMVVRDFIVDAPRWLVLSLLWWYFAVVGWALITHG